MPEWLLPSIKFVAPILIYMIPFFAFLVIGLYFVSKYDVIKKNRVKEQAELAKIIVEKNQLEKQKEKYELKLDELKKEINTYKVKLQEDELEKELAEEPLPFDVDDSTPAPGKKKKKKAKK